MIKNNDMKAVNEKEFLALIEKYESIKLDDLVFDEEKLASDVLCNITGFNDITKCTLCVATGTEATGKRCEFCVYSFATDENCSCIKFNNETTCLTIRNAKTPVRLLAAIKDRAEHMKKVWKQYLKQSNEILHDQIKG
jgi:hypothetical protein